MFLERITIRPTKTRGRPAPTSRVEESKVRRGRGHAAETPRGVGPAFARRVIRPKKATSRALSRSVAPSGLALMVFQVYGAFASAVSARPSRDVCLCSACDCRRRRFFRPAEPGAGFRNGLTLHWCAVGRRRWDGPNALSRSRRDSARTRARVERPDDDRRYPTRHFVMHDGVRMRREIVLRRRLRATRALRRSVLIRENRVATINRDRHGLVRRRLGQRRRRRHPPTQPAATRLASQASGRGDPPVAQEIPIAQNESVFPASSSAPVHLSLGAALQVAAGASPDPAVIPRWFVELELPAPLSAAVSSICLLHLGRWISAH